MSERPHMWAVNRCSNVECPNAAPGGTMAVIHLPVSVGGHRSITLVLCAPCASAIHKGVTCVGS